MGLTSPAAGSKLRKREALLDVTWAAAASGELTALSLSKWLAAKSEPDWVRNLSEHRGGLLAGTEAHPELFPRLGIAVDSEKELIHFLK